MDPIIILVLIAAILLMYQLFYAKDPDKLDAYGHEVNKREKDSRGSFGKIRERIMLSSFLMV